MKTQADVGIGPVSCENCSVFKKGEGGPEAPGALRLRKKKATASVASSYSKNPLCKNAYLLGPYGGQICRNQNQMCFVTRPYVDILASVSWYMYESTIGFDTYARGGWF